MERRERIKKNLTEVQQRIEFAAQSAGRKSDEVVLIGVSKYVDAETTRDLVNAGCLAIGESRPQVFKEKNEKLSDLSVQWHLIGHLQRNKIKFVLPHVDLIHSVDSLRLIDAIEAEAVKRSCQVNVLLEVNISNEPAKHGFSELELAEALDRIGNSKAITAKGLMGMSRLGGDDDDARREFGELRKLRDLFAPKFSGRQIQLTELSMGMTGDFEIAIAEGATMVRIGSALFDGLMD